jgi:flagellar protein FliL
MAKKKKGEDPEATAAESGGGGSKKLLLVAVVVVAVAVLGAGAMAGGLIGGGQAAADEAEVAATPTPEPLGTLVQLEPLTINLADGRFVKVGAALELAPDVVEEVPTAPVYDALIAEFNRHTMEELTDPAARAATKAALLAALAPTYGDDIVDVYYTEFVMQ